MLESELLRKEKGITKNVDLEKYKWEEELKEEIFNIKLDKDYEDKIDTMKEVYEYGINIGCCGLTSRYLAIHYPDAKLHKGTCSLVRETKNSPNGEHAWIERENYFIDTTLMIKIPISEASKYYESKEILEYRAARSLSEYNLYSDNIPKQKSR